jgi:hypothetical protein
MRLVLRMRRQEIVGDEADGHQLNKMFGGVASYPNYYLKSHFIWSTIEIPRAVSTQCDR